MANSSKSSVFLENYSKGLFGKDLERYMMKVEICGVDPYTLDVTCLSALPEKWPNISHGDITNYLIFSTNSVTLEQMKCFKSMDAHNFFTSGWVHPLLCVELENNNILLLGKVNHSQSLREAPVKLWILAKPGGEVVAAHCSCMAGRGEVCSHVGAVLFSVEYGVRQRDAITCTSSSNKWLPPTLKAVPYRPLKEIDFSSKDSKKRAFDSGKLMTATPARTPPPCKTKEELLTPSNDELNAFITDIHKACPQAAILRILPGYCEEFIPRTSVLPPPLTQMFDEVVAKMPFSEILEHCDNAFTKLSITPDICALIQSETKLQAQSNVWFLQRAGRITASKIKAVCHTDPANPAVSLIKSICYPEKNAFSTKATRWGCEHEEEARLQYEAIMKNSHERVSVSTCGLHINPLYPHLGASPDGIIECSCCGSGIIEIKCPYCSCDSGSLADEMAKRKISSMPGTQLGLHLNNSHPYYYQVQCQLLVVNAEFCDFVVWSQNEIYIERVESNIQFQTSIVEKATHFFKTAIMPELVGRFFTSTSTTNPTRNPTSSGICFCNEIEEEPMVICSNPNCVHKKFHWRCLKIKMQPRTKQWLCPDCKKVVAVKRKRSKKV